MEIVWSWAKLLGRILKASRGPKFTIFRPRAGKDGPHPCRLVRRVRSAQLHLPRRPIKQALQSSVNANAVFYCETSERHSNECLLALFGTEDTRELRGRTLGTSVASAPS